MQLKLFIFDCDGTIVDSQQTIVEGMAHAFVANGHEAPSDEATRSIIGLSLDPAVDKIKPGLAQSERDLIVEAYKDHVIGKRARNEDEEVLYEGAADVITKLAQQDNVLLGIATGKAYRGVLHLLDRYGWHDHFVTIQTADRAPSKPHPGMILQAMEQTGVAPEHTVMIGDTSYDMDMAMAAKVTGIGVTWGYHEAAILKASGAHHLVDDYRGLDGLLGSLAG